MESIPIYKVVVAGDGNVGKTSLVRRYSEGRFETARKATIGVDFQTKVVALPGGAVKLSIWDLAGQARFKPVRAAFYRGSRATALVFDLTVVQSLVDLYRWYLEIVRILPGQQFLLVGNKADLPHKDCEWAGERFARMVGGNYLKTSALTGEGVERMFKELAQVASSS